MDSKVNQRVKQVRQHFRLTQEEFGARLGVSRDVIANIECERVEVSDLIKKALSLEFRVSLIWLDFGDDEMFQTTEIECLSKVSAVLESASEKKLNLIIQVTEMTEAEVDTLYRLCERLHVAGELEE